MRDGVKWGADRRSSLPRQTNQGGMATRGASQGQGGLETRPRRARRHVSARFQAFSAPFAGARCLLWLTAMAKKVLKRDSPKGRKLTLKKETLKDLAAPSRGARQPKGGRSSSGGSIAGSIAGSNVT